MYVYRMVHDCMYYSHKVESLHMHECTTVMPHNFCLQNVDAVYFLYINKLLP